MEKYELEKRYQEDDEIDLVELLKSVIREKKLVIAVTMLFTLLAGGFAFYKDSRPSNYGAEISFSEETNEKIAQLNAQYGHSAIIFKQTVQDSFNTLLEEKNSDIITFSAEDKKEINDALKEKYNFIKIIDTKNKNYKLFTKAKKDDLEKISAEIKKIVTHDAETINSEFKKNLAENIIISEKEFLKLTDETKKLNKDAMKMIKENFNDISKENMSSNFSIISPILYIEYQEKINSLNKAYLENNDLKRIQNEAENLFELSGNENITILKLNDLNKTEDGMSSKLILAIGIILGLFAGIFTAIVKEPLKNILKEIKAEK